MDEKKVLEKMNQVLEHELSGVVRYTHYSFMVFGKNRIPIVKWLREQAYESLRHGEQIGEHITSLGGHPSLKIAPLLETEQHDIMNILKESLEHEQKQVNLYYDLLKLVENKSIYLEEYARSMIQEEEGHISEVKKMLRQEA